MSKLELLVGKFEDLHFGHERFFRSVAKHTGSIRIGLFSEKFLASIGLPDSISPYETRISYLSELVRDIFDTVHYFEFSEEHTSVEFLNSFNAIYFGSQETVFYRHLRPIIEQSSCSLYLVREGESAGILKKAYNSNSSDLYKITDSVADKINQFQGFSGHHCLVLGDYLFDEFTDVEPVGISQESTMPAYQMIRSETKLGGAYATTATLISLGASVTNVIRASRREISDIEKLMDLPECRLEIVDSGCADRVLVKRRFEVNESCVFRVNEILSGDRGEIRSEIQLLKRVEELVDTHKFDSAHICDFSGLWITDEGLISIIELLNAKGIPVVGDSQYSAATGRLSCLKRCTYVAPTEHEIKAAMAIKSAATWEIVAKLKNLVDADVSWITYAEEGIVGLSSNRFGGTDILHVPALAARVKTVSGAGDVFLAAASLAYVKTGDLVYSSVLGSICSALRVEGVDHGSLSPDLIRQKVSEINA